MTDRELLQQALDALIDAADSQNWEMQQNIDQHGEWYRRSVYLKQATTNSQEAIKALRARLSQCERCGEVNPAEIHTCTPLDPLLEALRVPEKKREWVGLTKEEAREICVKNVPYVIDMVAALEAKLKEKNS